MTAISDNQIAAGKAVNAGSYAAAGNRELEGFVVYPTILEVRNALFLSSMDSCLRLSSAAVSQLGSPEYVVLFFDEKKKRAMVMAANQKMDNVMKLSGGGTKSEKRPCCITFAGANKMVRKLAGCKDMKTTYRFPGHAIEGVEGKIIFELSRAVEFRAAR